MSDIDLTTLLRSWPYEPGRICARRIAGDDDRPKLQVRLDLGVLQMEMQGRPDGLRPEGFESLLAFQQDRLERYAKQAGDPEGFVPGPAETPARGGGAGGVHHARSPPKKPTYRAAWRACPNVSELSRSNSSKDQKTDPPSGGHSKAVSTPVENVTDMAVENVTLRRQVTSL